MLFIISIFATANTAAGELSHTKAGIALDKPWKVTVYEFSRERLQHSAWGVAHCERDYLLSKKLARLEKVPIDDDVLFAAAFLHDMGVFPPYVIKGAEHSKTAAEKVESVLRPTGFPLNKLAAVKAVILSHMFYAKVADNQTARVLHDADTLDFLGNIGIARLVSVTSRHRWATDLSTAVATIEKFNKTLPPRLIFASAKKIALGRIEEASLFVKGLRQESYSGSAL